MSYFTKRKDRKWLQTSTGYVLVVSVLSKLYVSFTKKKKDVRKTTTQRAVTS